MDSDVLIVSYDRGYGNEIPILLVGRNTDKGMEIIKVFEREEANKVYELLSKWNKSFIYKTGGIMTEKIKNIIKELEKLLEN